MLMAWKSACETVTSIVPSVWPPWSTLTWACPTARPTTRLSAVTSAIRGAELVRRTRSWLGER